jgi:hypothetical protein
MSFNMENFTIKTFINLFKNKDINTESNLNKENELQIL